MPRPSNFEANLGKKVSKADEKSSHKLVGSLIAFLMDSGTNLGGFWEDFAGQVGAKLGQDGTKLGQVGAKLGQLEQRWAKLEASWSQVGQDGRT